MLKARWIVAAITLAFAGTASAEDGELAKIRAEIAQMKRAYEQRIEALEKRLTETEAKAGRAEQSASNAQSAAATVAGRGGDNAFNPAISMVLQGTYARTTRDPESHRISGFMPSGGEVGPPKRSFGLAETELAISANIDPYFRGVAIAALAPEGGAEVEEAYFQTRVLERKQYEAVLRLLTIFAQHLASISNRMMVREAQAESPVVARARGVVDARRFGPFPRINCGKKRVALRTCVDASDLQAIRGADALREDVLPADHRHVAPVAT